MKVSVIIPVYNTAEYLPQCLDSVTAQSHSDLEIIAVDDGSTDSSAEILQRHAATDGRLRVISQPNRGVSAARNAALDAATGEYVVFVDSDDCIDCDHISLMAGLARPDNAVFTGTVRLDGGHKSTVDVPELEGLTTREAIIALRRAQYFGWVYSNIFSMEIIRREGLRFDESMRIHEDEEFKARYMRHVSSIASTGTATYLYTVRKNSAVHTQRRMESAVAAYRRLYDSLYDALPDGENRYLSARIFLQQCAAALRRRYTERVFAETMYALQCYLNSSPEKFIRDGRDRKVLRRSRIIFACHGRPYILTTLKLFHL